jgi:soluble P-type ATPase
MYNPGRKAKKMIKIDIPGWGDMEIENIVLDMNGTIATDGKILPEVKEQINVLSKKVKVYVLTADIYGTAIGEMSDINVELVRITETGSQKGKVEFVRTLELEKTVAVGNGNSDQLIMKEACLGIAVLGEEGIAISTLTNSDLMVKSICDALDLFLKPERLIATLRQ